jgi:hypothetical protein
MHTRRSAGIALAFYGVVTFLAFGFNAPGGNYSETAVARFISSGHMWTAFGLGYLGILGALAILVFGARMRGEAGSSGDLVWGLTLVGTATSLVGWFVTGGLAVAMAEGGDPVRGAIAHPVVYTVSEIGNLLAVCSPALCVGVASILLARQASLPRWLQVFTMVAGVCGVLASFYFTYFVFVLWTLVAGMALAVTSRTVVAGTTQVSTA